LTPVRSFFIVVARHAGAAPDARKGAALQEHTLCNVTIPVSNRPAAAVRALMARHGRARE